MTAKPTVDVQQFIDDKPFSLYQWLILGLCFLIIAIDGFDTAIIGFLAPALSQEWGVEKAALVPVLSAALVGLAIGALLAGPLADRIGRKKVLLASVLLFGFWTLMSAFAGSIQILTALRFLTGLGLGAAMPNAVTLMSEYAPQRKRSMIVNTMFCGFTLGSALGGFVAAWMIPHHGWHSMFIVGGCLPLLLALLLIQLPESPRFMVVRRWPDKKIADVLNRIAPGSISTEVRFTVPELVALTGKTALAVIFSARYRFGTLMLWLTYFMGLLIFYLLTSWMPTLIKNAGFSLSQASTITALFPLGGVIGTLAVGWLMDRMSAHKAIAITYVLTGIFVYAIGRGTGDAVLLGGLMFIAGLCMNGAQSSMPALAAGFYPTQGRATGVAWMLGIGRLGGILGATIGGQLLQFGWSLSAIFSLLALPAFVAAAALLFKHLHLRSHGQLSMAGR